MSILSRKKKQKQNKTDIHFQADIQRNNIMEQFSYFENCGVHRNFVEKPFDFLEDFTSIFEYFRF